MAKKTRRKRRRLLRRMLSARGRSLEITKSGWLFIVLTLAVGFAAINSGSNLLHVVFGCQIGMILASGVLSESMVRRASVSRTLESPAHARSPAALTIALKNSAQRGELLAVSVEDEDGDEGGDENDPEADAGQARGSTTPVFALAVAPGESSHLGSRVTMPRRGRHRLPSAVVATRFPFGLFVKRRELPVGPEIIIYPHVHPVETDSARRPEHGEGETAARGTSRAGEFFGLREYRDGDDAHRINWPATARLRRPVVSEFEAQVLDRYVVQLDPGVSGDEHFEKRVEDSASLAVAVLRQGHRAVGLAYGDEMVVAPGSGPEHEARILGFLAMVGSEAA